MSGGGYMRAMQDKVDQFITARAWDHPKEIKDLLLNMNEEIGEFWNLIKWVDWEQQVELVKNNKAEVENFIGDMQFLLLKIAVLCKVDSENATQDVLDEYEKRFPAEQTKGRHANLKAGGIDLK